MILLLILAFAALVILLLEAGKVKLGYPVLLVSVLASLGVCCQDSWLDISIAGRFARALSSGEATLLAILSSGLALLISPRVLKRLGVAALNEFYILFLSTLIGVYSTLMAAEVSTFFVSFELLSLSLYCMCASSVEKNSVKSVLSSEAGLKYFMLGSFGSAIMLYGFALCYGVFGSTLFATFVNPEAAIIANIGFSLIICGIAFKLALVPFHFWCPDVYQGSPTSVTAFMASVVKVCFILLLYKFYTQFGSHSFIMLSLIWLLIVSSLVYGVIVASRQSCVKRMLAYSGIANASGFAGIWIITGGGGSGSASVLYYFLFAYGISTIGVFAVLLMLSSTSYEDLRGLAATNPWIAGLLSFFLLAFAGLPPSGISILVSKLLIFQFSLEGVNGVSFFGLALIAGLSSIVSCYFYIRPMVNMYFSGGDSNGLAISNEFELKTAAFFALVGILLLGVFPNIVM